MDDVISRQTAIEAIKEDKIDLTNPNVVAVFKATGDFEKVETQVMTCDRHIKILKELSSAQPERKTGRWNCSDDMYESAVCSVCGWDTTEPWNHIRHWFNYCPNCGADMREVDDESD